MNDRERDQMRAQAVVDQAWAEWGNGLATVERLAAEGPSRPEDAHFIRGVCCLVAGELHFRAGERELLEAGEPT